MSSLYGAKATWRLVTVKRNDFCHVGSTSPYLYQVYRSRSNFKITFAKCSFFSADIERVELGKPDRATQITRNSAIADGPRDASCQSKSCLLQHNCKNNLYSKSTTTQSYRVTSCRGLRALKSLIFDQLACFSNSRFPRRSAR